MNRLTDPRPAYVPEDRRFARGPRRRRRVILVRSTRWRGSTTAPEPRQAMRYSTKSDGGWKISRSTSSVTVVRRTSRRTAFPDRARAPLSLGALRAGTRVARRARRTDRRRSQWPPVDLHRDRACHARRPVADQLCGRRGPARAARLGARRGHGPCGAVAAARSRSYQPQYDVATGVMTGVEALLRWQHPELGLLGAGPLVTAGARGAARMRTHRTCAPRGAADMARWPRQLGKLRVSLNITAADLGDPGFADRFAAMAGAAGASIPTG